MIFHRFLERSPGALHLLCHPKTNSGNKKNPPESSGGFFIDLAGIRTQDPIIKSDVLYQLSYEV